MTKELGISNLSIANPSVPLSQWIRYAFVQSNWSEASSGVFESANRLHLIRSQTPLDIRPTIATTTSRFRSQLLSFQTAGRNINEASTLLNVFATSLDEIGDSLASMKTLATDASAASMTDSERSLNDVGYQQFATAIDSSASLASYNDIDLLNGSLAALRFQVSIRGEGTHQITLPLPDLSISGVFGGPTTISTQAEATSALASIESGLDSVETSKSEAAVVLSGLTGSGTMSRRVIAFMTQKLESLADRPIDQGSVEYVLAALLQEAEVSILAQDPTRLDEAKGAINALDLVDTELPVTMNLYSLNASLGFSPRVNQPYVNVDDNSGVTVRNSDAPYWNIPEGSE